jgi:uncharacterized protein (DUF4415 family)
MSEEPTVVSASELDRHESDTDWDRVRTLTDEEIERAVEADPDQIMLDREWFERAQLVAPSAEKERITIRLDEDIVDFFKSQGSGYQTRINAVLRAYVLSQKLEETEERAAEEA